MDAWGVFYEINCNNSQKCMKRWQRLKGTEGTVKDENEKKNKLLLIRKKHGNLRE